MEKEDSERLAGLFDSYAVKVHRYVRRRVSDASAVDDLVSEVFLTATRRICDIPEGNELPWLYVTARNTVSNWRRRATPSPVEDAFLEKTVEGDARTDISEQLALQEAWRELSETDREVLRLAAWEGLSGKELAGALEMTEGGAASALSRARARLATTMACAV